MNLKKRLRRGDLEGMGLLDHTLKAVRPGPNAAPGIDEPLPDAMYQVPRFAETHEVLRTHFSRHPLTLVSGNSPIYYEEEQEGEIRTRWVLPDCYVAFGVDAEAIQERNGYFMNEVHQSPNFALEIASVSTYRNDLGPKREIYGRLGIGEYWRFDGTGGPYYGEPLVGETLVAGEYQRLEIHRENDGLMWGHSPALGLDLCWVPDRLRFFDPATGAYLRNLDESEVRGDTAEALADTAEAALEASQAETRAAEARAQAAEEEAHRLAEELRRLRG